ncbi:hypothetical protein CC80DRAFT_556210 [Byssothecium circinans]|uniref:Uncharacterized protein n=1 Tax=Byssothecium circinans TaxID=147558 RepID=A0A6A5T8M9_9PLEO|nr:hypothetical protein CC80DRAFT_556210 [Byssothecium circinans]
MAAPPADQLTARDNVPTHLQNPSGIFGTPVPTIMRLELSEADLSAISPNNHPGRIIMLSHRRRRSTARTTSISPSPAATPINLQIRYNSVNEWRFMAFEHSSYNTQAEWEQLYGYVKTDGFYEVWLRWGTIWVEAQVVARDAPSNHCGKKAREIRWVEKERPWKEFAERAMNWFKGKFSWKKPKKQDKQGKQERQEKQVN